MKFARYSFEKSNYIPLNYISFIYIPLKNEKEHKYWFQILKQIQYRYIALFFEIYILYILICKILKDHTVNKLEQSIKYTKSKMYSKSKGGCNG